MRGGMRGTEFMGDLFGSNSRQLGLDLGDSREPVSSAPAVTAKPLGPAHLSLQQGGVPANEPLATDEERDQLCFELFRELERIELLMAPDRNGARQIHFPTR